MKISAHLVPDAILPHLHVTSKKQALQALAQQAADITGLHQYAIFEALLQRERLGTTGVGDGIAIPHGRVANIAGLFGLFARLDTAIDFEADDGRPVDLIFLLLAPEAAGGEHLAALAGVTRLLRNRATCEKLRRCRSCDDLLGLMAAPLHLDGDRLWSDAR